MIRDRVSQLPFVITLIAMPLPWVLAYSMINILAWLPEALALLAFTFVFFEKGKYHFKPSHTILISLFIAQLAFQIISGQGAGGSAVVSVILIAIVYYQFLCSASSQGYYDSLIRQVTILYSIHVCFILFEIYLLETNNLNILDTFSRGLYKSVWRGYGQNPQSLSLQSQAASQFSLFAVIWFSLLLLHRKRLNLRFTAVNWFVLISALCAFAVYPNTTSRYVGLVLVFCSLYLFNLERIIIVRSLAAVAVYVFYTAIYEGLTYKFDPGYYFGKNISPLHELLPDMNMIFSQQPVHIQLFGAGDIQSVEKLGILNADLGIGMVLLAIGAVFVLIAICALIYISSRIWNYIRKCKYFPSESFPWLWLGTLNVLLAIGNVLSLGHYTVSLQLGGRTLFSYHIAVIMLSLYHLDRYRRQLGTRLIVK